MRFALVAMLAGCSFHAHAAADSGGGSGALIDDTAAQLMLATSLDGAVVDPLGTLEPEAYVLGGLRARAYDGKHVSGATTSWADIDTEVAGALLRGVAYQQLPTNWMSGHPSGLGLSAAAMPNDNFTILYDGELFLAAGDHTIDIDADDAGALEVGQMFVVDAGAGVQSISVHIDADAWVPLRMAIGDSTGNAQLIARVDGTALAPEQTRARVTDDRGLLTDIYYTSNTSELQAGPVLSPPAADWGMTPPPFDLGAIPTSYTARFMGQLRIDHDGTYTLATATTSPDDGSELFIDGHLVSRTGAFTDPHPASATLALAAGWHGIVVELTASQKNILGGNDPHAVTLATTIAEGSGPAVPVTADMLRPAAMSGYYAISYTAWAPLADATGVASGITSVPVPVAEPAQPAGAIIDSALYGYFYYHATPTDYAVTLDMAGTPVQVPSTDPDLVAFGDETAAGAPVPTTAGAWSFTFTDSVPGNASGYGDPSVFGIIALTTHGGPQMPFAPTWTYTSAPRALGDDVTGWGPLTVTGALTGATLAIAIRAAPTADGLATAPWIDVGNGAVPVLPPNPFVEYRITVTGDGWAFPTIDKVELDYQR